MAFTWCPAIEYGQTLYKLPQPVDVLRWVDRPDLRQFKVPLASHQAIQMMLADMATQTEAARQLVYRAAQLKDLKKPYGQAAAMAKLFAAEASGTVTDLAVQIFGGYGYSKSYPVERYWRDARVTRIYEGTSEVHRMVIARGVMDG